MNTWSQVLARIEQGVERSDYENWLARTRFVSQKGDTLDIAVPSQRFVDEIRERFGSQIRGFLNALSPAHLPAHLAVAPPAAGREDFVVPIAPPKDELPSATFN